MNALEQRRFWNGVDLHLGAIEQTNARERERERETERKRDAEKHQQYQYQYKDKKRYVCMKMH